MDNELPDQTAINEAVVYPICDEGHSMPDIDDLIGRLEHCQANDEDSSLHLP